VLTAPIMAAITCRCRQIWSSRRRS